MSDHAVRLRAVLSDLQAGRVSTADAAAEVRTLSFPVRPRRSAGQLMRDAAEEDVPARPEEGSVGEIAAAYHGGKITFRQYEVLAQAATEAMQNEHGGDSGAAGTGSEDHNGG